MLYRPDTPIYNRGAYDEALPDARQGQPIVLAGLWDTCYDSDHPTTSQLCHPPHTAANTTTAVGR